MALLTDQEVLNVRLATYLPYNAASEAARNIKDLQGLIMTNAQKEAMTFQATHKVFATDDGQGNPINSKAERYLQKMFTTTAAIIQQPVRGGGYVNVMMNAVWAYFGIVDVGFTFAQVNGANADQLSAFLDTIMGKIIESVSGVRRDETAEYNAL